MDNPTGEKPTFTSNNKNDDLIDKSQPRPSVEEEFEDPVIPDIAFNFQWTVWEQYDNKGIADYTATMMKVAWFGDPITFWRVWSKIPHSDPKNFFTFNKDGKPHVNFYNIRGIEQKVVSLAMFKTGILPAWEDKINKYGGEFSIKIGSSEASTGNFWNALVQDLVSDNFPAVERVCGIRILDKGKLIKIEVWVDFSIKSE